jgi:hypothetical protein
VSKDVITSRQLANVQKFQPATTAQQTTITCMHVLRGLLRGFQVRDLVSNVALESMQLIQAPRPVHHAIRSITLDRDLPMSCLKMENYTVSHELKR